MRSLSAARVAVATVLTCGTTVSALVFFASPAAAISAPTVSKTTVTEGETFTVSGTGCINHRDTSAPAHVAVFAGGTVAQMDASPFSGDWSVTLDLGGVYPGTYPVTAVCSAGEQSSESPPVMVTLVGPPQWWEPGGSGPRIAGPADGPAPTAPPTPQTTAPRTTAPRPSAPASPPSSTPSPTPPSAPSPSTPPVLAPIPAQGCTDCERLASDSLAAGEDLALSYSGFQPFEQVTLVMRSTPVTLGTFTADAAGVVTATVTLPATSEAGPHTLTLSGPLTGERVVDFRLAAAPQNREPLTASPSPRETDRTWTFGLGGGALLLLGSAVFIFHRRRAAGPSAPTAAVSGASDDLTRLGV